MSFIGEILMFLLQIYFWIVIISVLISWMIHFEVINTRNPQAQNLVRLLNRATDPVFKPIGKFVPPVGGIDLTPLIVIFGIFLLQNIVARLFFSSAVTISAVAG